DSVSSFSRQTVAANLRKPQAVMPSSRETSRIRMDIGDVRRPHGPQTTASFLRHPLWISNGNPVRGPGFVELEVTARVHAAKARNAIGDETGSPLLRAAQHESDAELLEERRLRLRRDGAVEERARHCELCLEGDGGLGVDHEDLVAAVAEDPVTAREQRQHDV